MRGAGIQRAWYDDVGAMSKWWAVATGFYMVFFAFGSDDRGSQPLQEFTREILPIATGFTVLLVVPGMLAFSRQGRLARFLPKLVGALGPWLLIRAIEAVSPGSSLLEHPILTSVVGGCVVVATWLALGQQGRHALRRALASASSIEGWSAPARVDQYRLDDLLERGTSLTGMDSQSGHMRMGTIGELRAVAFSGSCVVTAVPETVDWQSKLALAINIFLTKGRSRDADDFSDSTRVFVTTIAVRIPNGGSVGEFDLRSRHWRDGDVVYTNADDRTERFESIDLDRHHQVRVPNTTSQLEAWASITPDVVVHLARMPRVDLCRRKDVLVATRIGGCGTPSEVDELVDAVTWFALDLIPGSTRRARNLQTTPDTGA